MNNINYTLITKDEQLKAFYEAHKNIEWIAFDTEFISEKRYFPQLCLIQVASTEGYFLLDTLVLEDISLFLELVTNEAILKITHAGANDYRLFYQLYRITPRSVYDVQIAAGFIGHRYPLALGTLLAEELKINIDKSQKVSDWAERPMSDEQIKYALIDVLHLEALTNKINSLLEATGRKKYAIEEMKEQLESLSVYAEDPIKSLLKSTSLLSLPIRNQLFYIRMTRWREQEASRQNITRNMVLDNKMMTYLAKNIQMGVKKLQTNRRAPKSLVFKQAVLLTDFYEKKPTEQEQTWLNRLPRRPKNHSRLDLLFDQIDLFIRFKGKESSIDPSLILSRTELNKIKLDAKYFPEFLEKGWRRELLGEAIIKWLKDRKGLQMSFEEGKLIINN
ncbi:MAG: ribonuclease D [Saprospiraceae bacterium]